MPLTTGTRIGPYDVGDLLGAGAMGEVYHARDSRLAREVAIKVLPAQFSADPDRLRRFDQEARAAGTLNHRNILAIHDLGSHEGMPYVVSELLRGKTLRERLKDGALPRRKALEIGRQIALGLAPAHARGVVHRDLKPENLFVTDDGTVKILDFGLAKLMEPGATPKEGDSYAGTMTNAGLIMGTVGYMAPEHARGQAATAATDVFALGCVLYEMVTGERAFQRGSPVETLSAIMNEDPAPFSEKLRHDSPALVAVVLHCLEKEPGERFQSARDLAFALGVMGGEGARSSEAREAAATADVADSGLVSFRRLTFRRGSSQRARFTPDGFAFLYGGAWEGQPVEPFWVQLGNAEGRSLGHPGTDIHAVSPAGDLALCLKRKYRTGFITTGTLARQPMGGGAPRQLLQNVDEADWSPDGTGLAIVRDANGRSRLEHPVGRVIYETTGWISHPRFSRDGKAIAFIHHEYQNNDGGSVMVVDLAGQSRMLSPDWGTIRGLAWSPDGQEIWFSAHREGAGRNLVSVDLAGHERYRLQVPGQLCIQDTFPDGRVLLTHSMERQVVLIQTPGESQPRDLSWMDWTLLRDISTDGQWVLLVESGEGGGAVGAILMRPTDGSAAVNLGEGNPLQFSPDGQWVLALARAPGYPGKLVLLPTGVGEPRSVETGGVTVRYAQFVADGKSLIVAGTKNDDDSVRLWRVSIEGGEPTPVGPSSLVRLPYYVSPDGRWIAAREGDKPTMLYPVEGGDPIAIPGLRPEDELQPWTMESSAVLVMSPGEMPALIHRIDLETGARTPFREIAPPDAAGVYSMRGFRFSPDGQTFGYTFSVQFDDLYLVDRIP